ncbi:type VI secretion system baseplate subunit TssF [Campylobacter sp. MIT 21-1685]|uniref:type VI secretion system baseplate subunit TssF n=1 Tax=unclassified Campylobacter TaxID=2593542 RepID=UPI00224B3E85|nr:MULTISPECIES: type VI secretion system baseplate subunit TssF [unclassified Campylobacter]MCX2683785.1 type VI secretion system baseplate subunit TssF [Campylobacter sp. MIT 21-1684]MCX2752069.1 type VI secretion system baseplate subunit TssF [Campylobacter sp. MIT 21-1682]MCX2808258.1 type VI secretion system baseplate subunit TssF [Campylobacter sp. MIT 21-1685]
MNNEDVFYYQKELSSLYQTREYFVKKFPKLAPFLALDSKDPDIERIIENLAILTSKIHQEMEQNIPYIAESLLNVVSPNYTNPLPSLCLQEFFLNKDSKKNKVVISKGSRLQSITIEQIECEFRTVYDVYLYPLDIDEVFMSSEKQYHTMDLRLKINKSDLKICDIGLDCFNLYLGDDIYTSATLLLFIHLYLEEIKIISYDTSEEFKLNPYNIKVIGLEPNESCLNYDDLGFEAFSLLREYFFIPEKFNFIKIQGLDILRDCQGKNLSIQFKFNKIFPKNCIVRADLFSLSVTPIVNIFPKNAESIINDHTKDGYRIFVDRAHLDSYEIIKINQVKAHNSDSGRRILKNYKSFERFEFLKDNQNEFYNISVKKNSKGETYKEISFFSEYSYNEIITIDALCCNKNLPSKLKLGDINHIDFQDVSTKNIKTPSIMREYSVDGHLLWKLVSILSFNYQSLLNVASFFGVLESYSFVNDKENEETYKRLKNSILYIDSKSTYLIDEYITKKGTLCIMGIKDSNFYSLGEVYKLGLVISKFFASFVSINSFCELKIKCLDSKDILYYPATRGKKVSL